MECQSQLESVKDLKPRKRGTSVGWTQANQTKGTPTPPKASMEQPLTLATKSDDTQKLEQNLTQIILSSQTLKEALFGLAQTIAEAFGAEGCLIAPQAGEWASSGSSSWYMSAEIPSSPSPAEILSLLTQSSFQAKLDSLEPLAVPDLQSELSKLSRLSKSSKQDAGAAKPQTNLAESGATPLVGSVLALKTQFQGQVNGLVILLRSQPYHWKDSDVQLLKTLSPQVAIALSQTHLEQQVQQQIRHQNLVNQLTSAIRNNWDLNRIFQLAIEGTAAALQVDRGMILLFKYTDPLHRHRSTAGIPKTKARIAAQWLPESHDIKNALNACETALGIDGSFWASDCSLCQQILVGQGEVSLRPDLPGRLEPVAHSLEKNTSENNSIATAKIATVFCHNVLPSLLLVPLENQGTILGCLSLQQQQWRSWSSEEVVFVKLVAAQLSTAIIQSRTMQQIQSVVQERTAQLQRSLEVQAKLYEKTKQQVEQLRRLNEEREEFLSTVSHELRTPLTSMTLAIRMLRQADLSPERRVKYLDILEQQCVQETQLINDLLALRKLESSATTLTQLQKLDTRYLVRDIAQSIEEEFTERGLKLELDLPNQPVMIYTEADSINRIVMELLTNAKKYSQPDSVVQLRVAQETPALGSQAPRIVLQLRNTGDGISPEELNHIFEKFRRGRGVTKQAIQGTGLGLALVKGLVEHLGGTIAASSQPQEQETSWETCFTVTLPQFPPEEMQAIS